MKSLFIGATWIFLVFFTGQANAKDAIDRNRACEIAQARIDTLYPSGEVTYLPEQGEEYEFGWVFHIVFRKYVETRSLDYIMYGAQSLLVEHDGAVDVLPHHVSFQNNVVEYVRENIPRLLVDP